jgi:hypothetical protein
MMLTHAGSGTRMSVPDGWEVSADANDATVVALEPPRGSGDGPAFRASLVLTAVATGADFRQWQVDTDVLLPGVLADYQLLDLERVEVAGRAGGRRLARHRGPDGTDLTMEQWFVLVDGTGITVTATVDSWRYDGLADDLARHARSLAVPDGARP